MAKNQNKYDLIVLDPPAFAKHRDAVKNALRGYQRLNAKGIQSIRPGGILFTFSCSQAIDKEMFRLNIVFLTATALVIPKDLTTCYGSSWSICNTL